ncbi:Rhs family protein [Paenibacillus alvei A6-6i-x]|nr:RHS repeat-associated core domain-containing protein [Paenibacillus alvei]EPY14883.1 Rhs family protein [Paenibacillus alvei A6-6i-x]
MQYYVSNGHGDITEIRDAQGNVLNRYTYDIWGNPLVQEEQVPNIFRYSGEYWDAATNLQYLRARWYDPSIGRFVNEDTYEGEIKNPLSLNLYTYVHNNPLSNVDPTGHIPRPIEAAELAAHIYELKGSLSGGWTYSYTITGGDNMVMGVYYRTLKGGTFEYALVNKGSDLNWSDWKNNALQPIGYSADMKDSIKKSTEFVNANKGKEITMVGHSKGGAEATANAVANNKNAITFNTSPAVLWVNGLSDKDYTGTMTHYVVKGELLNHLLGEPSVGSMVYSPQIHKIKWWYPDWYNLYQRKQNHSMDSVKESLKAGWY